MDKNEKDLNKVIEKIQKLIKKPPLIVEDKKIIWNLEQRLAQNQQTIIRLEKRLATKLTEPLEIEKNTNLKTLTKIEEVLNTSFSEFKEQTKNVNSCQELDNLRDKWLKEILLKLKQQQQQFSNERKVWVSSLLVSSLVSALLLKRKKYREQLNHK